MDLAPWQRKLWTAMYLGSVSFLAGHAVAAWLYDKLTGRNRVR